MWWPLYKAGEPVDWMRRDLTRLQCQWEGYKTAVKPNVPSRRGTPAGFHSAFQLPKSGRLVSLRSTVAAAACGLKRSGFLGEMPMASARGRWRRSGRSLLKLMVALCFFASAISLCYLCFSSDCGGSGCVGFRRRTVLLRLDFGTRGTAYFGANQQDRSSSGRRWRRLLAEGPGSYPPRCTAKCGACVPCYPVHVAVPPGVPVTTEYYPEAWRCKCGNRLYMP